MDGVVEGECDVVAEGVAEDAVEGGEAGSGAVLDWESMSEPVGPRFPFRLLLLTAAIAGGIRSAALELTPTLLGL